MDLIQNESYKSVGVKNHSGAKSTPVPIDDSESKKFKIKRVSSLRRINTSNGEPIGFTAPSYKVYRSGTWRTLSKHDSIGKDQFGNPVKGKTWVKAHSAYNHLPEKPKTVLLKSRISEARKIVKSDKLTSTILKSVEVPDSNVPTKACMVTKEEAYNERRKLTKSVRYAILKRDGFKCKSCGIDASAESVKLEVDHVTPKGCFSLNYLESSRIAKLLKGNGLQNTHCYPESSRSIPFFHLWLLIWVTNLQKVS